MKVDDGYVLKRMIFKYSSDNIRVPGFELSLKRNNNLLYISFSDDTMTRLVVVNTETDIIL